jgi:hypothetical protein
VCVCFCIWYGLYIYVIYIYIYIYIRFVFGASFCISMMVLNFFASVLLDAMDAMFFLYAVDRDHR